MSTSSALLSVALGSAAMWMLGRSWFKPAATSLRVQTESSSSGAAESNQSSPANQHQPVKLVSHRGAADRPRRARIGPAPQLGDRYRIRTLEVGDHHKGAISVLRQLSPADIAPSSFVDQFRQLTRAHAEGKTWVCMVVEDTTSSRIIATGSLFLIHKLTYNGSTCGQIEDVVTDDEYRGMGIGSWLVNELCKAAQDRNCRKVTLQSSPHNVGWYMSLGFSNPKQDQTLSMYFTDTDVLSVASTLSPEASPRDEEHADEEAKSTV